MNESHIYPFFPYRSARFLIFCSSSDTISSWRMVTLAFGFSLSIALMSCCLSDIGYKRQRLKVQERKKEEKERDS